MNDLCVVYGPHVRKIGLHRGGVAAHEDAQDDQRYQSDRFCRRENVLNPFAQPQSPRIRSGKRQDQQNPHQLLPGPRVARRARPELPGGRRNRGHDHAEKAGKRHGHRGDGSGLNDQKKRPAVKKAPQGRI